METTYIINNLNLGIGYPNKLDYWINVQMDYINNSLIPLLINSGGDKKVIFTGNFSSNGDFISKSALGKIFKTFNKLSTYAILETTKRDDLTDILNIKLTDMKIKSDLCGIIMYNIKSGTPTLYKLVGDKLIDIENTHSPKFIRSEIINVDNLRNLNAKDNWIIDVKNSTIKNDLELKNNINKVLKYENIKVNFINDEPEDINEDAKDININNNWCNVIKEYVELNDVDILDELNNVIDIYNSEYKKQ